MRKLFVDDISIEKNHIMLKGSDYHHIVNVLRYGTGDKLNICDGRGREYTCVIGELNNKSILCNILENRSINTEPDIDIILFQGIAKSSKMDYIIQKSVEIGIKTIVPFISERTVVRLDRAEDAAKKAHRWQRISTEASKQTGRGMVPQVHPPVSFKESLDLGCKSHISIIPWENEKNRPLKEVLSGCNHLNSLSLLIGPEGGFTEKEIHMAQEKNIIPVTLGPRILRTETAGMVIGSIIMYLFGDLGGSL